MCLRHEVVLRTDNRGFKVKSDTSFASRPGLDCFGFFLLTVKAACFSEGDYIHGVYIMCKLNRIQYNIILSFLLDVNESLLRVLERDLGLKFGNS